VRQRTQSSMLEEIEGYVREGRRHFLFQDDTFTMNPNIVKSLCTSIIEKRLAIRWTANGRVPVSPGLLELMVRAGCMRVFYGIETVPRPS